jgi:arsenate reductase
MAPRDLLRKGEPEFSALGLDDPELDDDALVAAMAAHPKLIERPVFVHRGRAVVGRPPERVLELLD